MDIFRSDKAVELEKQDRFQRYEFSKKIASLTTSTYRSSSLVIGIYGKWGEGKTSTMNFVKTELLNRQDTIIIDFNPWLFSDEKQLLKSFFENFASQLGRRLVSKKRIISTTIASYADSIGSIADLFGASGFAGIVGNTIRKFVSKYESESVEKIKAKIDRFIIDANCYFVVFVDDIDRLDIQEVQSTFKLIKLVADFPRTSYVLSFDDMMVASALGPRYGKGDQSAGYQFLEKIVQVPVRLPKASKYALRKYSSELLEEVTKAHGVILTDKESKLFREQFEEAFLTQIETPRTIVRYANAIAFSLPLLRGEVNIADLFLLEGVKIFYPEFYVFIRDNSELFLRTQREGNSRENDGEFRKKTIQKHLELYSVERGRLLLNLLQELFPQLQAIFSNTWHREDAIFEYHREKRVCSGSHFTRYFSYVVQEGEVPDTFFSEMISVDEVDIDELVLRAKSAFQIYSPGNIIFKLQLWQPALSHLQSKKLAIALSQLGNIVSQNDDMFMMSSFGQLSHVISKMIIASGDEAEETAKEVINSANPFDLAIQIVEGIRIRGNTNILSPSNINLKLDQIKEIRRCILSRYKILVVNAGMLNVAADQLLSIFYWWYQIDDIDVLRTMLRQELEQDASAALKLIKVFIPTIQSFGSDGQSIYKGSFTIERFAELAMVIDLEYLYNVTINSFGVVGDYQDGGREKALTDNDIVGIFQNYYRKVSEESVVMPEVWDKMVGYYF